MNLIFLFQCLPLWNVLFWQRIVLHLILKFAVSLPVSMFVLDIFTRVVFVVRPVVHHKWMNRSLWQMLLRFLQYEPVVNVSTNFSEYASTNVYSNYADFLFFLGPFYSRATHTSRSLHVIVTKVRNFTVEHETEVHFSFWT